MARLILILAGTILLLNTSFADILVQPGYGQPHPVIQPHEAFQPDPKNQVQFIHQPRQWSGAQVYNGDQLSPPLYRDSETPYRVEVQPVYLDNSQTESHVLGSPLWQHHPMGIKTKYYPHKHLHVMKIGGASYVRPSIFIGDPQHNPLVHSRYRRSASDGPSPGLKNVEYSKDDVASKSTLDNNDSPVVGLQNQEGQVHTSKNERAINGVTLLGLHPPEIHPGYHNNEPAGAKEHAIIKNSPSSDEERPAQTYRKEITNKQSERQEGRPMRANADHNAILANQERLPQVMLLQASNPQSHPIYGNSESAANLQTQPMETMRSYHAGATVLDEPTKFDLLRSENLAYQPMQRNFPDPRRPTHFQSKKTRPTYREDESAGNKLKAEKISTKSEMGRHESSRDSGITIEPLRNEQTYKTFRPSCTPTCYYYTYVPQQHCNCPCCGKSHYSVHETDEDAYNDFDLDAENVTPQVSQYYRTARSPISYFPSARYYYLPQSYNIYGARYGGGYVNYPIYRTYEFE